jgi:hypothetical protein
MKITKVGTGSAKARIYICTVLAKISLHLCGHVLRSWQGET